MNAQMIFGAFLAIVSVSSASAEDLIRLPKQATGPVLGIVDGGKIGPTGKETNLEGWLVLNGASFQNAEYLELAENLREVYARANGYVPPDPDVTPLANEPHETKPTGEIVRGIAICPLRALCGGIVGTLMPFNLDSSM
ncbi:hypothetical protein [Bradyrhizobium lablabi]|uniref:hypothetical protein n=1 Tax=Bradyrhizobium lablabi TaxID=722472 RepID=UPI00090BC13D|nr:hypothetical protein [Bradyrhizobium lablabi]SHM40630.1 hypothetical protein SAMN05444321_6237 [Bradyrhizobium lablabi]